MPASVDPVAITVGDGGARVSGLLMRPSDARWLYLLAHGAGAGMRHPFLETIARALAGRGRATLHLVEGGDHSFKVLKRTGKTESDVMGDLVCAIVEWTSRL